MNRIITMLMITIARHVLLMARGPGDPGGLLDSGRAETRTTANDKTDRRLTAIAIDILLMAHGLEDR